jgi:hypothetical protein
MHRQPAIIAYYPNHDLCANFPTDVFKSRRRLHFWQYLAQLT